MPWLRTLIISELVLIRHTGGRMSKRVLFFVSAVILLLGFTNVIQAENETSVQYIKNGWNFVDQSMDVSQGIPEDATGVLGRIRDKRTLRVATEPYFPPQEFIDPTKVGWKRFAGSDMQLAQLIADRMGVSLEIVPMAFSDVLPALDENTCDIAISALAYTPDRASAYVLSKGYYFSEENSGSGILVRIEDKDAYHSIDDFSEKVIAAQAGSLQESMMASNFPKYREFIRFSTQQDVYSALETGKVDAVMTDIEMAQNYIGNKPECQLVILPDFQFQMEEQFSGDRIAARAGQLQLIAFVNGVIDEVVDSGLYMQWYREAEKLAKDLGL